MADSLSLPRVSRRHFLAGAGAAAVAGSAVALGVPSPARAAGQGQSSTFSASSAPKPIEAIIDTAVPGFEPPDPFRFIHWLLPGPEGSATQILELPGFGLDADPSLITDYRGFTAYAVLAGTATGNDGSAYDVEFDVRVMDGEYVGEDGNTHEATFGFF